VRVADETIREHGGHGLVVARAARVEPTVLLDELEGIALPILALRFHHIDVGEEQDRLELPVAAVQDGDQRAVIRAIRRREDLHVACRDSRSVESGAHGFGRARAAADGAGGVDLDQLLVEVAECRFAVGGRRCAVNGRRDARRRGRRQNRYSQGHAARSL
jgi:hypothetical protein